MPGEFKRQLSRRVQEFELYKDDKDVFKDVEYARRRADRRRELKRLESDKRLKCWKKVYVPSLLAIFASSAALLCSSISSLGQNSFFFAYKDIFHIVGPIVLIAGIIGLMVAAACSYREEERLRIELGLPSQFPQGRSTSTVGSIKSDTQSMSTSEVNELLSRRKKRRFWKKASSDSLEASNFLESSCSSAATDMTWMQHSASRPITLEVAEAHVFEECEEEGDFERVVDTHITARQYTMMHPQTSKTISDSNECFVSENSSGYSTVAGSEPDNAGVDASRSVLVEVTGEPGDAVMTESNSELNLEEQR